MKRLSGDIVERIYKSILSFLGQLNLDETYKSVVEEAVKLVDAEYGSLVLKVNDEFVKIYSAEPGATESQTGKKADNHQVFTKNQAIIANVSETLDTKPELKKAGNRSIMHIPLTYRSKTIGVLTVNSKKYQDFGPKEKNILNLFGSIASLAIRKAQLNDETEKALKSRDMFIAMAAHEFKTPLTTIHGYAQLLLSKTRGGDSLTHSWAVDLNNEIKRLTSLTKELLEIDTIKTGELNYNFKEANLKDILDKSAKDIKFGYPQKKIIISSKLNINQSIVCDIDKLSEVFTNVIENAAKYSPESNEIRITLSEKNSSLRVVVTDKGIGIPEGDLEKIFDGYYRSRNHNREGLGLGLFLSKNILDKHLGKFNIRSKINRGTSVEILLPKHKKN